MLPAPVDITVSQLRDALWQASGRTGPADGPGSIAGQIFHETMAGLVGSEVGWQTILRASNLGDHELLRRHAYEKLVGPRLTRFEAALKGSGRETLWLWEAVGEACQWLCGVLKAAETRRWIYYDTENERWSDAGLITAEHPVEGEFHKPGWSAPVRVHGIADAVIRDPSTGRWCCIEFKLTAAESPLDVCQAAMYHALLAEPRTEGEVALVRFTPKKEEMVLGADRLEEARDKLIDLAGAVAGVTEGRQPASNMRQYDELGQRILGVLETFNAAASLSGRPVAGPAFVRYTLKPGPAVAVRKILNSADDLGVQLGLPAPWIDVEDGILVLDVGRGEDRETVPFARIRETLPPPDPLQGWSDIPLGVDLYNQLRSVDISAAESPHVLVAGTAGSGKSEWLRTAIAALILTNTPETLRLMLIDPKRTAFGDLAGSPFLLHDRALLFPPDGSLEEQLDLLIDTMEERYRKFHAAGVDDLKLWRLRQGEPMPRIVCVVDEFADMMADARDRRTLEDRVVRLGAKARAAGIHLVLSTQHPDAKTITGRLQANLSVRVCLKTTTWQQSMVALKRRGAERLLGRGDLFFSRGDRLYRLQGAFLSEQERREIFHKGLKAAEPLVSDSRI
jgi:DNA segregation ATPase FtsK/SpoIIIE, S-DNA-T family